MNVNDVEKNASGKDDRREYIAKALAATVAAAGLGAVAKHMSSKSDREKMMKRDLSRNAIVIPIVKKKFMEGLPTPEALAAERGESASPEAKPQIIEGMDMNAVKKDILRNNSRQFDFFRKAAEEDSSSRDSGDGVKAEDNANDKKDPGKSDEGDKDDNERTLYRDQTGKFISPTDPLAVAQAQKEASGGGKGYDWSKLWDIPLHPIDTLGVMWDAAKDHPVKATAAALGSFWLAGQISNAINSARKKRAQQRADEAREQYAEMLERVEGNEKSASGTDPRAAAGAILGASVIVPAAITAMVVNRIFINRREEQRKEKERSDSYPDDPVILYKTSEGKDIEMSPEAALAVMEIKSAMVANAEYLRQKSGHEKIAAWDWASPIDSIKEKANEAAEKAREVAGNAIGAVRERLPDIADPYSVEEATDRMVGLLTDDKNSDYLARITRSQYNAANAKNEAERVKYMKETNDAILELCNKRLSKADKARLSAAYVKNGGKFKNDMQNSLMSSNALQGHLARVYSSGDKNSPFAQHRDEIVADKLGKYVKRDSWLHKVLMWIMNTFGISQRIAANKINEQFNARRAAQLTEAPAVNASQVPPGTTSKGTVIAGQ